MNKRNVFLWLVLAGFCFPALAGTNDPVREYMETSGLSKQIAAFPEQFTSGLRQASQQDQQMDAELLQGLLSAADDVFISDILVSDTHQSLQGKLSDALIEHQFTWYRSELGLRVTRAEMAASEIESINTMLTQMEQLLAQTNRLEKVRELDLLVLGVERSVDSLVDMQVAIVSSILGAEGMDDQLRQSVKMIEDSKEVLRSQLESFTYAYYIYTYQDFTDREFDKYLSFLGEPESQQVIASVSGSMDGVMKKKYRLFSEKMATQIQQDTVLPGPQSGRFDAPGPPL